MCEVEPNIGSSGSTLAAGDGLRLRHELLPAAESLAACPGLEPTAPRAALRIGFREGWHSAPFTQDHEDR